MNTQLIIRLQKYIFIKKYIGKKRIFKQIKSESAREKHKKMQYLREKEHWDIV